MAVLSKKIWTKCFSEFLADIDPRNQSLESDVGPREQTDSISVYLVLTWLLAVSDMRIK